MLHWTRNFTDNSLGSLAVPIVDLPLIWSINIYWETNTTSTRKILILCCLSCGLSSVLGWLDCQPSSWVDAMLSLLTFLPLRTNGTINGIIFIVHLNWMMLCKGHSCYCSWSIKDTTRRIFSYWNMGREMFTALL